VRGERSDMAERITQVALECFCARGYEGTSVRDLAAHLEVTPAALYYHYKSKDEILEALLEPLVSDLEGFIADAGQVAPTTDTERRHLLQQLFDTLLHRPDLLRLLVSDVAVAHHPTVRSRLGELSRRLPELLLSDDASPVDRIRAAAAVGALLRPLVVLDDAELADHGDEILDAALRALDVPRRRRKTQKP
jgi:AcrR family transcriptional regulator